MEKVPERQRLHAVFAEPPRGTLMPMVGLPVRKKETLKVKKLIQFGNWGDDSRFWAGDHWMGKISMSCARRSESNTPIQ